jgi:hypothetical protein
MLVIVSNRDAQAGNCPVLATAEIGAVDACYCQQKGIWTKVQLRPPPRIGIFAVTRVPTGSVDGVIPAGGRPKAAPCRNRLIGEFTMRSTGLRLVHMKFASVVSTLLILSVAWLSGCAASSSASGAWQASAPHPSFSRILIVGVSANFDQRCAFEYSMASWFSGGSTLPLASCDSMMPKDPLTRANIERVAAAQHADAVLTSAVVTLQVGAQPGYKIPYYQVTGQGYVTGPMGEYGVPVAFLQLETTTSIPTISGDIHIVTKLFDTRDATLVYTADMQAKSDDVQSSSTAIETITGLIAARLRRDGVIH